MAAWIRALRAWEELAPSGVCPGHGPAIGASDLRTIRAWFEQLVVVLGEIRRAGVPLERAVSRPRLPPGYWPPDSTLPAWWPSCVARAWEQAG